MLWAVAGSICPRHYLNDESEDDLTGDEHQDPKP